MKSLFNFALLGALLLGACGVDLSSEKDNMPQNEFQELNAEDSYCSLDRWSQAEAECLKDANVHLRSHIHKILSQWQSRYGFFVAPQFSTLSVTQNPLSPFYKPRRDTGCLKRVLCKK